MNASATTMRAMVLTATMELLPESKPLTLLQLAVPEPAQGEIRIEISACGVCHTELDEIEGRTPPPHLPVVPGHEVVGRIDKLGRGADQHALGSRVGVGWIHHSDGSRTENLSERFLATGRDVNGGYAQFMTVHEDYAYPIPDQFDDTEAAPLLCAGAVGYRALRLTGLENGQSLGLCGFGGCAHLILQIVKQRFPDSRIYVFARQPEERRFSRELGADWAGDIEQSPPQLMNAIIDTTPAWLPVVSALGNLKAGGRLVINAIRKENRDIARLTDIRYEKHLWMEKEIKTVANVTRQDLAEFLPIAAACGLKPQVQVYPLEQANQALTDLKFRPTRGARVLEVTPA